MKKLYAIAILALFLISLAPVALAEEDADQPTARDKIKERLKDRLAGEDAPAQKGLVVAQNFMEKHRDQVNKLVQACVSKGSTEEKCKATFEKRIAALEKANPAVVAKIKELKNNRLEKLKELKQHKDFANFKRALNFKVRSINKIKLADAKKNFLIAKENYGQAKKGLEDAKLKFEKAKILQACKDDPESEECAAAKEELRSLAKEKLGSQVDMILETLAKVKHRVEESETLSEEQAANIIAYVDEKTAEFEAIKAEIEAAETKEDIVAAAKDLREAWANVKFRVKAHISYMVNSRMAGIIVKADHLEMKLERVLERMEENGKDTSVVEPLVEQFDAKIAAAKEKFEEAQDILEEVRETKSDISAQDASAKIKDAHRKIKDAQKELQDANKLIRDILRELQGKNAITELDEANEAEEIESEAEEEEIEDEVEEEEEDSEDEEDSEEEEETE